MNAKRWTPAEVRAIARETLDGRQKMVTARGAYFHALVETTQAELGGRAGQAAQLAAVRSVHRKFYPVVQEAIASDDVLAQDGVSRKRIALERNRRTNFCRSAYGTIRRWLRADGHDLMKLDAKTVTKSQLLQDAPPTRKHALTPERVRARAKKLTDGLLGFATQVAQFDQDEAAQVLRVAMDRLFKELAAHARATTNPKAAAEEKRPLRIGRSVFVPVEAPRTRAA